jgi:hypothetical protein
MGIIENSLVTKRLHGLLALRKCLSNFSDLITEYPRLIFIIA